MILYFIAEKCLYTKKKQIEFYREEKIIGKKDSVKNTKRRAKILKNRKKYFKIEYTYSVLNIFMAY